MTAGVRVLAGILAGGFLIRLLFLPATGFHNDVSAFEAWTLTLGQNPPWEFYAKTSFADYPPGYFLVLWVLGAVYHLLGLAGTDAANGYFALRVLVKLPAVLADLADVVLIYALVRRFAREALALGAAALFAFNPASIYVSAYWGQIDSLSWGLVLFALWMTLRSGDAAEKTVARLTWVWAAIALSVLVKPQAALVGLVVLAYAFTAADDATRRLRLRGTALGIGVGLVLATAIAALFHPGVDVLGWLLQRYAFGSAVYPYNSVNAFNLYALKQPFWQSDLAPLTLFGIGAGPLWLWGIILVLAATALVVMRYLQQRDDRAFLEAAMLVALAFFTLATRMHERYIYGAFLLAIPLVAFGARYWAAALALSLTTVLNLGYSLAYQTVMEAHTAGVDATNIWPIASHVLAGVNVATFFLLGYLFLGGTLPRAVALERPAESGLQGRPWFDPREGIAALTRRDAMLAAGFALASFVLCIAWIQWPAEKVFDEIYYARAGEEYLAGKEIFEFTHPPFTKLIVTLSMLLFGGLHGAGDTALGWRFLNVVVGALMVGVLYLFAKKLTRSTFFAAAAAAMLLFDGFHYVQARIATPEITVAFLSLCTLYAFYEVWTRAAVRRVPQWLEARGATLRLTAALAAGALVAGTIATALCTFGPNTKGPDLKPVAWLVAFLYVELCVYLAARVWLSRGVPRTVAYADGSRWAPDADAAFLLPEGTRVPAKGKRDPLAEAADGPATRRYLRDGRLEYVTPAAAASYAPDGSVVVAGVRADGTAAWRWIAILAVAAALLAASKWNGLFDFFVVWICTGAVVLQRFVRRPALFGNPFGLPLDVIAGSMLVVAGAIYALCYIPFFALGHNFVDMVELQREMYHYHASLVATHPYASQWWQWPILERPISYFYSEYPPYQTGTPKDPAACCVAEILALPNPFVWWFGLLTVPLIGLWAWRERNRGYALLVVAYFLQWLPWIGSPRIAFEYHFFPNLAIIVLANAIVLQRVWHWRPEGAAAAWPRYAVGTYLAVVVAGFAFFFPVLAGVHVPWDAWHARMWISRWII